MSVWEKVRQNLDPAFSYVVFEKAGRKENADEFQLILAILSRLTRPVRDWKLVCDAEAERLFLVVRLAPGPADDIVQELVQLGLPKNTTFYAYASQTQDEGRTGRAPRDTQ